MKLVKPRPLIFGDANSQIRQLSRNNPRFRGFLGGFRELF